MELHGVIKIKIIEHNSVNIYVLHVDFYFYDGILKLDIFRRARTATPPEMDIASKNTRDNTKQCQCQS